MGKGTIYYRIGGGQFAGDGALAIYENGTQLEIPIYGASRLGMYNKASGTSVYQLTDHLGNVRAVIAKNGSEAVAATSTTDYYPFGMPMPNRQIINGQPYRYAYQGQEKDSETGKEAFQLRLWDARIGRWLTTDPKKEFSSPYLGMGNNPIRKIDPDGGHTDDWVKDKDGKYRWYESVTSKQHAIDIGVEYIGKNISDVSSHFMQNSSSWSRNFGEHQTGLSSFVDYNSYYQPKVNDYVQLAFDIMLDDYEFKQEGGISRSWRKFEEGKDFYGESITPISKAGTSFINLKGSLWIDGVEHSYRAEYSSQTSSVINTTGFFDIHPLRGKTYIVANVGNVRGNVIWFSNSYYNSNSSVPIIGLYFDSKSSYNTVRSHYIKMHYTK